MKLAAGGREGQWSAKFPRNDELVCSYEPHILLANLGNVDWRPMMNLWAVVEYVSKYAMKAPGRSKTMRQVLREAVEEVCKYTKEGEPLDLMRSSLQKFYAKNLGGRDYCLFEAVHVGLGLPLVYPLLPVQSLNTAGTRVLKSGKHLAGLKDGEALTWDSKVDKFDKRLALLRKSYNRRSARGQEGARQELVTMEK